MCLLSFVNESGPFSPRFAKSRPLLMRSRSRTRISPSRIFLAAPLLDRRDIVNLQLSALHDDADEGRGDALARRPADLRRVLRPSRRVALADDLAVMHHHDRAGIVLRLLESPVERGVDAGVGLIGGGVRIAERPRLGGGVWKVARHGDRLEMNVALAARQDRAALIAVELRHARRDGGAVNRHRAFRLVNGVGEALVPAEIAKRRDVLREDLLGGSSS